MFRIDRGEREPGAVWPSILVGLFAAFGGILFGYDTGTISGLITMPYWQKQFGANPEQDSGRISLIVSVISIGTFVGSLSAAFLADLVGRKWGIILSVLIPFNLGVILQTAATDQGVFIAGRLFAGLGVGLISCQIPMFQSETLPKWIRGAVVGTYQFCITIGLFVASVVNYSTSQRGDSGSYRIPLAVQFLWSLILMGGMLFLPETPRYLVKKGKDEQALKSLSTLRRLPTDDPRLLAELETIKQNFIYEQSLGSASYAECFRGNIGKRVITGILLQSLQQLVGINFIIYYGTSYFAGHSAQLPQLPSAFILQIITNSVNSASTLPGLYAIDRFGRRPVLLTGAIGMGLCQFIVAAAGKATDISNYPSAAAQLTFICLYIGFFAATWGPAAWVVTGEIFPLKVRAKALSMTTAANWFWNWVLSFITPFLVNSLNPTQSNVFWIWGSFCWIAATFVYLMIYETKGLTLEEVNILYNSEPKAWKSRGRHAEMVGIAERRASVKFQDVKEEIQHIPE